MGGAGLRTIGWSSTTAIRILPTGTTNPVTITVDAGKQDPVGSTQSPLAQANVQQSWLEPQLWPTALHCVAGTHCPLQAPEQHSRGCVQLAPSALQVAGIPQVELELDDLGV